MALRSIEEVALYALLLRECANNRHTGEVSLLEDMECGHGHQLNFAQMLAHERFGDLDWALVRVLCGEGVLREIARELYEHEQIVEAEALLHAAGPRGRRSAARWAAPFRERWQAVRMSMAAYQREGICATADQLNDLAIAAVTEATGATPQAVEERYGSRWDRTEDYLDDLLGPFLNNLLADPANPPTVLSR